MRRTLPLVLLACAPFAYYLSKAQTKPAGKDTGAAANVLVPQTGQGKPYGSRDPYKCSSTVAPKKGAISPELAAQYVTCGSEYIDHDDQLWLNEKVQIQVGHGVPAAGTWAATSGDVDPHELVYPIRGSLDRYLCSKIQHGSVLENEGKNCALWHWDQATGNCYRTTFGDWKCGVTDVDARQVPNQPPPTK